MAHLSVLVLTEDSASSAGGVLAALVRRMFQFLVPDIQTQLLDFEPPEDGLRRVISANRWKSASSEYHRLRLDLVRTVATFLARSNSFVVFHYDGDVPYSEKCGCPHDDRFLRHIVTPVRALLASKNGLDVDAAISRLLVVRPFYCIEAWLYQNYDILRGLVASHEYDTVTAWSDTPGIVEEVVRPWEHLSVGKSANALLAEKSFPTSSVFAAQRSFHDDILRLLGCAPLLEALERLKWSVSQEP